MPLTVAPAKPPRQPRMNAANACLLAALVLLGGAENQCPASRAPVAPPTTSAPRGARHHHRRPAGSPGAGWRPGAGPRALPCRGLLSESASGTHGGRPYNRPFSSHAALRGLKRASPVQVTHSMARRKAAALAFDVTAATGVRKPAPVDYVDGWRPGVQHELSSLLPPRRPAQRAQRLARPPAPRPLPPPPPARLTVAFAEAPLSALRYGLSRGAWRYTGVYLWSGGSMGGAHIHAPAHEQSTGS